MSPTASVLGASGYAGGELLRLLYEHPELSLASASSRSHAKRTLGSVHPNLRGLDLRFCDPDDLEPADVVFAATPHGVTGATIDELRDLGDLVVDLSADFRLTDPEVYADVYGGEHPAPELLETATYGLVECNRSDLHDASLIAVGGCNATATILALYPLASAGVLESADPIVVDLKVGSSEGGRNGGEAASHVERSGVVRPYAPLEHRHEAEIEAWLETEVSFTAHAVDLVRGASATCHVFPADTLAASEVWGHYRSAYDDEPFVRFQSGGRSIHRYPEPKAVAGTNYAEIGFAVSDDRLVVFCAIDNLGKGSAGQAIHATNVACGFDESAGLTFPGLHPVGSP